MVKTYLKKHFTKVLQGAHDQKTKPKGAVGRKKVGLTHYGEALTSDEVFFRLREQAAKKSKAATTVTASKLKKAKKAPNATPTRVATDCKQDDNYC